MTYRIYDPPNGDYWSLPPHVDPCVFSTYTWRSIEVSFGPPPDVNYYFWLGKDGEADACA